MHQPTHSRPPRAPLRKRKLWGAPCRYRNQFLSQYLRWYLSQYRNQYLSLYLRWHLSQYRSQYLR